MQFGKNILAYQNAILDDLARMVEIPSVCSQSEEGKPFGAESALALNRILDIAGEMGFETKNVGNYAGHAEYGEGAETAAVITHVDVVPAGDGWDTPPFRMTKKGNLVYGRGTADDKGAAIVALYCLKALRDAGVHGKRRMRVIFGAGEEIASDDMKMYFRQEEMPVMAFTPDSEYGICNREKGILRIRISSARGTGEAVRSFAAGIVVNAVPALAEAAAAGGADLLQALQAAAKNTAGEFRFEQAEGGVKISSVGKASHAMQPQEGINAASNLITLLSGTLPAEKLGAFLGFLRACVGTETDGASIGVKMSDEPSGALTFNLGILHMDVFSAEALVDIRYPVTCAGTEIFETVRAKAEQAGLKAELLLDNKPLYFPENDPLVRLLQESYCAVEGVPAELYATGGGTYAREVPGRAVAFGPFFADEPDRRLHNSNESIDIVRFMEHAQICLEAMYRMMTE